MTPSLGSGRRDSKAWQDGWNKYPPSQRCYWSGHGVGAWHPGNTQRSQKDAWQVGRTKVPAYSTKEALSLPLAATTVELSKEIGSQVESSVESLTRELLSSVYQECSPKTAQDANAAVDAHRSESSTSHANSKKISDHKVASSPSVSLDRGFCPAGHQLRHFEAPMPSKCRRCEKDFALSTVMQGCRICDFDVCEACGISSELASEEAKSESVEKGNTGVAGETTAGQHLLAMLKHEAPDDTFLGPAQLPVDAKQQVWWWFWWDPSALAQSPQPSKMADESNESSSPTGTEETTPPLKGDETLMGPDGALYEVFYPAVGDTDEKEEVSTACSESPNPETPDAETSVDREAYEAFPYPVFTFRETSAEAGIADVVEFMRAAAVARYPAKARFFELVQEAAAEALGPHFERLALVGSTAIRIDTPDSDLDVVAFTRSTPSQQQEAGGAVSSKPPSPVESLRRICKALTARDPTLKLQLVDCSRVPVLTAVSADGLLSLDLTVDQPLGEWHAMWFQSLWQTELGSSTSSPSCGVPAPTLDPDSNGWELGLEAAALRCVKWWLRRRRIPVSREGGYPTVVWTLMVLHVLRCSLFIDHADMKKEDRARALLGAIAAFFDRFSECRCAGTLLFSTGPGGVHSEFHPMVPEGAGPDATQEAVRHAQTCGQLSVLDPTTTSEACTAWGIEPYDLAPQLPQATRLLHAYELQRAQKLSAAALAATCESGPLPTGEVCSASAASGGAALTALFSEPREAINTLPITLPEEKTGVLLLRDGFLQIGILKKVEPKPGWAAPFLHRRDNLSAIAVELCDVDLSTGALTTRQGLVTEHWFHPCDFVCLLTLKPIATYPGYRNRRYNRDPHLSLDKDGLERWTAMRALLNVGVKPNSTGGPRHRTSRRAYGRGKWGY
eukprot:TRINITY_DN109135_c0_g1_i1.p1 TRINITY_DN109135_c0_g1~~TRINITY_DN109135_c0_g1_i1.p1  ORF type:complete len:902 (-),score=146.58 TRINITY_DN109135_c0_g1_i1:211-2916(-)